MKQGRTNGAETAARNVEPQGGDGMQEPLDYVFDALRRELGDDPRAGLVKVWRIDKVTGKRIYCQAYSLAEIEGEESFFERIRDDWGGGTFQLTAHDAAGFRLNRQVPIADRPGARPRPNGEPIAAAPDATLAVLQAMQQQLAELTRQLAQPRETEADFLARLKAMRDLFGAPPALPSPAAQVRELLGVVNGARELRDSLGDSEQSREPSVTELGMQIVKVVGQALGNRQPEQLAAPGAPLAQLDQVGPENLVGPQLGQAPQPMGEPMPPDPQALAVREAFNALNAMAKFDTDIETAADVVYDQVDDAMLQRLARDDWWQELQRLAPSVGPFEDWYARLRVELLKLWREANYTGAGAGASASAHQVAPGPSQS